MKEKKERERAGELNSSILMNNLYLKNKKKVWEFGRTNVIRNKEK